MNQQKSSQPSQDSISIQLLQALAQSQTVAINTLQRLNERIETDNSEHVKLISNQKDQIRSLNTKLEAFTNPGIADDNISESS